MRRIITYFGYDSLIIYFNILGFFMDFGSLEAWGYLAVAFFAFGGSLFIIAAAGVFSFMGQQVCFRLWEKWT